LLAAAPAAAEAPAPASVQQLAWLAGCWQHQTGARTVDEHWLAPSGDSLLGVSRTVKDGRLVSHELMIIRARAAKLVFEAHPSGQPTAEFPATAIDARRITFENPAHDFPQRITYERQQDQLKATVEGKEGGKAQRIVFSYRRIACPGA
jgi:hypothetical protein